MNWSSGIEAIQAVRLMQPDYDPKQIHKDKLLQGLRWLLRFHFSTPWLLQLVTGAKRRGFWKVLERNGLVRTVEVASLHVRFVIMLTDSGVAEAIRLTNEDLSYDTRPDSINHRLLVHALATQKIVIANWSALSKYKSERMLSIKDQLGSKRPDAMIEVSSRWISLETELTPKAGRDLDQALLACARSIESGLYDEAWWHFISADTCLRYEASLANPIKLWTKNKTRNCWEPLQDASGNIVTRTVGPDVRTKVRFMHTNLLDRF